MFYRCNTIILPQHNSLRNIRLVVFSSQVVPGISIPAIIVIQALYNCRISAYRIGNSPYIEILQTTATARISHRRTKDARTYTRHTPGSHEPRTLSLWISRRDTPSSHTFKTSIAPASLSYGRFKSKRTTTAHERSAL